MLKQCYLYILCILVLTTLVFSQNQENPADGIVDSINANRTALKLKKLYNSPGLGCMALQLISECAGNCSSNNTLICHPPDVDITEVYAPNCGVELPTVTSISGRLVGCQWNYLTPQEALSKVLVSDNKSLSLLYSKEHGEVGVGYTKTKHGPFFWCVLFSSSRTNSTFVLNSKMGIRDASGCFSGTSLPCSSGMMLTLLRNSTSIILCMLLSFLIIVMIY